MKYRVKTMANLKAFWNRNCAECNEIKPARTNHCSICETCVFQMSHHCLFTNNCVGLENQRFFLLFILYCLIGTLFNLVSIVSVWHHFNYRINHNLMHFVVVFDCLLAGCLFFYNLWCWFLACVGVTTIEFMSSNTGHKYNNYDYSFTRIRDNLFKIFGTKSYFQIMSPSLRTNAFNGIEWSFQLKDLGFDEFGELVSSRHDEEAGRPMNKQQVEMTNVSSSEVAQMNEEYDPEGEDEADDTEIAI
uniref:Palmitoyltransferase n=1 Tax=Strombidium inclinatum TaxID=197538 RepID=A0A7S3IXH2_9SPIT|mmetsp:Transcript_4930/g.7386  ORF Transcript_4930/g.7386 Transcript_4930/m.7386 type:complete len:246 (+) Transcript_4930:421-1158(+)